jgi:ADP-ribose pyrophosphatase
VTSDAKGDGPGRLDERLIHEGRIVRLSEDRVRMPDGSVTLRELIRHVGASAIVPILGSADDPDPEILLIRQWRYTTSGEILEIPAGMRDSEDETFEACALRELREETGYSAECLEPLTAIWTTPGFTDERVHLFAATGLVRGERELDPDEFVEAVRMPLSAAISRIRSGAITDAKTVAGLLWVAHFRTVASAGEGDA